MTTSSNNKRIARNTVMLYLRMLLIMAVTLYTSRVVLNVLGVEDYGIYNVVGGVIAFLGFLNGSLSGASSRFITYALGEGNKNKLKCVFATVLCIHFILAGIILLLGETAGLWFVYHKLVIPVERMSVAVGVYHCSVLTAVVSIVSVPYVSLILAYERMNVFAYVSIIDAVLRLFIIGLLIYLPQDKMLIYAILYLIVQLLVRFVYFYYCLGHFPESKISLTWDWRLVKQISSYAAWTVNGNLAVMGYTQGLNILLNLFFGPAVNAGRGIAVQVQAAVMTFVQNFQMAVRPQIIKSYAVSDLQYMYSLIIASTKYGFFLLLILFFPIMLCIHPILKIWLSIVPPYTVTFVRIMLLIALLEPFKTSLINAIHATGDLKKFQICEGTLLLAIVPIAYILLKFYHISPETVMLVYFVIEFLTQGIRILIVLPKIRMPYSVYLKKIIFRVFPSLICLTVPLLFLQVSQELSWGRLFIYILWSILYGFVTIFILGLNFNERRMIYDYVKNKINVKSKC